MKASFATVIKSLSATAKETVRERVLRMLSTASRMRGADCLGREETIELCQALGHNYEAGEPTTFSTGGAVGKLEVMRCGVVRVNGRSCLYTDFGNRAAAIDFARPTMKVDHALAVWSHRWLGFHHFVSELFPKICRLRQELGDDLGGAKICYPMIHRRYEKEMLELLKLPSDCFIDTWASRGVVADKLTIVPMAGWFAGNPNVDLLRKQFVPPRAADATTRGPELMYLSRSGRRRCLNDEPIIERCKKLGFTVIDESSRSIAEQIELYRDAKILFGPHGSAFTNMVWAGRGTHVIEMIPSTFDVSYHQHLTESLGHRYTKISCPNGPTATTGVTIDFSADVDAVMAVVEKAVAEL